MTTNELARRVAVSAVALLLLAGCGGNDPTPETAPASPTSAYPASPSTSSSGMSLPSAGSGSPSQGGDLLPGGAEDHAGGWETSYGRLTFTVADEELRGTYDGENGTITGTVDGAQVTGEWFESLNSVECEEERGGSTHWGTFTFVFAADGDSFEGTWGYCEDAQESIWSGERTPGAEPS